MAAPPVGARSSSSRRRARANLVQQDHAEVAADGRQRLGRPAEAARQQARRQRQRRPVQVQARMEHPQALHLDVAAGVEGLHALLRPRRAA